MCTKYSYTNAVRHQFPLALILLVAFCSAPAQAAKVSLDVNPATPTSGSWNAGDLIEIILQVAVDGQTDQGFSGSDFKGDGRGLTVDTNYVRIRDVLFNSTLQVDVEDSAAAFDGVAGYEMDNDTWWYGPFTDFAGTVDFTDASLEAVVGAPTEAGFQLGLSGPINYLHLILEVQPGMTVVGASTEVTFVGQLVSYDLAGPNQTSVFGNLSPLGSDMGSGSFTLTNVPEPYAGVIMLVGVLALLRRRRIRE